MGEIERQEDQVPAESGVEAPAAQPSGAAAQRERERLASERVIINAPMSFAGAAQRAWRLGDRASGAPRWAIIGLVVIPTMVVWWGAVVLWYCTFGLFLVPYRLLRRGARKRKAEALRHREMLGSIESQRRE